MVFESYARWCFSVEKKTASPPPFLFLPENLQHVQCQIFQLQSKSMYITDCYVDEWKCFVRRGSIYIIWMGSPLMLTVLDTLFEGGSPQIFMISVTLFERDSPYMLMISVDLFKRGFSSKCEGQS